MDIEDRIIAALMAYENARMMDFEKGYTQDALAFIKSTISEYEKSGLKDKKLEDKVRELRKIVSEMELKAGMVPRVNIPNDYRVESYLALIEERKKHGKRIDDVVDAFISFFSSLPADEKEKFKNQVAEVLEDLNVEADVAHEYVKKAQIILNAIKTFKGDKTGLKKKALNYLKKAKKIREEEGEPTGDIDKLMASL